MTDPLRGLAPLASVRRGEQAESWHLGAVAVATPEGRLVARAGDPALATYLRSAAKPFQLLPLLLAGGEAVYELTDADLAIMAASHSGGPEHVASSAALLTKGGFTVEDLQCGAHVPLGLPEARELAARGETPTPLHNNCSGKHAGMLLACRLRGWPTTTYLDSDHPLQRAIRAHLAAFCRVEEGEIGLGIDGCSVPTFHLSLAAAARGYAGLADPVAAGHPPAVAVAAARVAAAMGAAPGMVAGRERFTTRLMEVTRGRVVGKEGAEGFYGVAVRGPVALGVALKIVDGGERARDGIVIDVLRTLGALSGQECAELADLHSPELRNHRGLLIGQVVPEVELEEI
ncbi:MAG: asparaginase [Thermoanaerobaculia bacterium]|nr:asparaginase [Thermoanaerobaculia bacterium]